MRMKASLCIEFPASILLHGATPPTANCQHPPQPPPHSSHISSHGACGAPRPNLLITSNHLLLISMTAYTFPRATPLQPPLQYD